MLVALPNSKAADSQCVHSISKDRQSVSAEKTLAMFWGHEDSSSSYEPCRTDQLTDINLFAKIILKLDMTPLRKD